MKLRNGFTLIEMLIVVFVVCFIIVIALPMNDMRAKKLEQVQAKAQLVTIMESRDRYKMEHGEYKSDTTKLANWKTGTKKYRFQVEYADKSRFALQANGDTDNDNVYDDTILAIDQSGTLTRKT